MGTVFILGRLVHLKQVDTKKNLIYYCNTTLKQKKKVKTGLATHFIQYHLRKQQSAMFAKIFNVEMFSENTLMYANTCVSIPALVLLPILPTLTFHQNTNRGLRK